MIVKYIEELAGECNKILSIIKKLLEKGYYDGKEDYVDKLINTYLRANVITEAQAEELRLLNRPVVIEEE